MMFQERRGQIGFMPVACMSLVVLLAAGIARGQIQQGSISIQLEPVASGLTAPLSLVNAPGDSSRHFIVDQAGKIRIVQNGTLLTTPFLDLTSQIPILNAGFDERGVLGLAFHPDYDQNGRFFVRYSVPRIGVPGEPCFGTPRGCHTERLGEFTVSGDPNVANPVGTTLFAVDKPQFNHNGGGISFGPDGYLYFTLGDGGGANDGLADNPPSHGPIGNGQNVNTTLGKIHRIDVSTPGVYSIPASNPFAAGGGAPEIYAYGLRNPFAFSFDDGPGGNNALYLADVGQNVKEEVDIIQSGGNYGWVIKEGTNCFDPFNPGTPLPSCSSTGPFGEPLIDPIAEYTHADGISIIGGFVYRGSLFPELVGKYIFGDFSTAFAQANGRLFYFDVNNPSEIFEFQLGLPLGKFVHGFGEDANGEIYVMTQTNLGPVGTTGQVFHITPEPAGFGLLILGASFLCRRRAGWWGSRRRF